MKRLFFLTVLILQLANTGISACVCSDSESVNEKYSKYDHVYLVEISHSNTKKTNPTHNEETKFAVYLTVLEVFKGSPQSELVASAYEYWHDPSEETRLVSSCSMKLTSGRSFVVFVNNGEELKISTCSANKLVPRERLLTLLRSLAADKEHASESAEVSTNNTQLANVKASNYAYSATHLRLDSPLQACLPVLAGYTGVKCQ